MFGTQVTKAKVVTVAIAALMVAMVIFKLFGPAGANDGPNPAFDGLFGLIGVAFAVQGLRTNSKGLRSVQFALLAYLVLSTLGYAVDEALVITHNSRKYPSIADATWFSAFIPYLVGICLLARKRIKAWSLTTLIDTMIFGLGVGTSFWLLIVDPAFRASHVSTLVRAATIADPSVDAIVVTLVMTVLAYTGGRRPALNILALSVVSITLADSVSGSLFISGSFPRFGATLVDVFYDLALVLQGYSTILHSKSAPHRLEEAVGPKAMGGNGLHMVMLFCAPLMIPASLMILAVEGNIPVVMYRDPIRVAIIISASTLMTALVGLRAVALLRRQQAMATTIDGAYRALQKQEQQLQYARKMEAVGQLAAGVAHEINTPVQFIYNNLEFLQEATALTREGEVPSRVHESMAEAFDDSIEGIRHIGNIVSAMRAFGHPGSDDLVLADVNEIIRNTLVVVKSSIQSSADVDVQLSQVNMVPCSATNLYQVFLNLLVNAADAIAETGQRGVITVRTDQLEDSLLISIHDTGAGMSPEVMARAFEPMYTTKAIGKGSGIGLALVWSTVVESHKGTVKVTSAPGEGTTFELSLPIVTEPALSA